MDSLGEEIYLRLTATRKPIASDIVRAMVGWSKKNGYGAVTLSAAPKARRLYSRVGFKRMWVMGMRLSK